ncbi:MAG: hypothetical protein ACK5OB_00730 [Pirellula sp.]|jgi:hypothetical protein
MAEGIPDEKAETNRIQLEPVNSKPGDPWMLVIAWFIQSAIASKSP